MGKCLKCDEFVTQSTVFYGGYHATLCNKHINEFHEKCITKWSEKYNRASEIKMLISQNELKKDYTTDNELRKEMLGIQLWVFNKCKEEFEEPKN